MYVYEGQNLVFGGDQIGWPKWDGSESVTTVTNGVATLKLASPKKLYDVGSKVTILSTIAKDWSKRLGTSYQEDNGNGSIDISKFAIDYTDYIIYADVTELAKGDAIEWKLIKPTVTVSVTGLPDDANGKELYFTGNFNGWTEPGKEGSYKVTVADGSISLVASVDAKSSGKFGSAVGKNQKFVH